MTTFQGGTCTGYEAIAPYRTYLDLSYNDKEFMTDLYSAVHIENKEELKKNSNFYKTIDLFKMNKDFSTYNLLPKYNLNLFKYFIDYFDFQDELKGEFTLFVPIDKNMDKLFDYINYTIIFPLDILKYHTLDWVLTPVELFKKRKLRLESKLRTEYFLTDGQSIITEKSNKNPNRILQSIKTDNGYIYIIERPMLPYIY